MSTESKYLLVVVGLFIVPRLLQRLRIPGAITCVLLGAVFGIGFQLFAGDTTVPLLATLGIVSLFLFAGLEVDFAELRDGARVVTAHLIVQLVMLALVSLLLMRVFSLPLRAGILLGLALLTSSAGFIIDSLGTFGLSDNQAFWVKTKAIAAELVALAALFVTVQSKDAGGLALSSAAIVAMVAFLPLLFRVFVARLLPFAPRSEFAFLFVVALICAYITRHLGVYYLVGAFVVGLTAVRLRKQLPALASEHLLVGLELFGSFFIPFYFFKAGLHLRADLFGWRAVGLGLLFVGLAVPLRVGLVVVLRRLTLGESARKSLRVGLALAPTLVFTMVLADILRERYALSDTLYGALFVYALVNTALPGFILHTTPEFVSHQVRRAGLPGSPQALP